MKEKLKDVFQDFAENTTAHAPPKILTHKHVLSKLFWVLLFLTGIGTFVYFSQELITSFLRYETTTDIELRFRVLEFPAVTVCNQNQFRQDRIPQELRLLMDDFLQSKRADMFGGMDKFEEFNHRDDDNDDDDDDDDDEYGGYMQQQQTNPQAPNTAAPAPATAAPAGPPSAAAPAGTPTTATPGGPPTTATPGGPPTTAAPAGPPSTTPAPPGKRRKRRSIEYELNEDEMIAITDMEGFYSLPEVPEMDNMTWFSNVGETSSEKTILLNLTQYISQYEQEDLIKAGHDIQEMLQECVFMGKTCGPKDFYHFYDMKYGNCYTFNSGMNGIVSRITNPGSSFGLSLTMFVNQNQYIPVLTQEAGIRVLLHKQGQVPIMEEDGFDAAPGTKSGISVRYVEVQRMGDLYGNCTSVVNRTASGKYDYYPGNYTQKACLKTCLQKGIIKACGCANPLYRKPDNVTICGPDDNDCVEAEELMLLDTNICSEICPTPCWESQYQYVISNSQWPSNNYMPFLKESLDERGDDMKGVMASDTRTGLSQQFLKLNVYYDNLNYYKYTERPTITFKDLIGALGGHLGLWIGMSVVSFVEVFELILSVLKWCIRKAQNNKTSSLTDLRDREKTQTPAPSLDTWVNNK